MSYTFQQIYRNVVPTVVLDSVTRLLWQKIKVFGNSCEGVFSIRYTLAKIYANLHIHCSKWLNIDQIGTIAIWSHWS